MFKQQLIIIRHARSVYNIRQTNELDSPLTEHGEKQAQTVAKFVAKHMKLGWFTAYTSPFLRCIQTAKQIAEETKLKFVVMEELREYINHSGRMVDVKCHLTDKNRQHFAWPYPGDQFFFKDEFNEDFLNRMVKAYHKLDTRSIVVTHGLPAMLLAKIAMNPATHEVPIWDHSINNASITYIINGRPVWYGRALYDELDFDPFDGEQRPYDACDLVR